MTKKIYYIDSYMKSFKELNANTPREEYDDILNYLSAMRDILFNRVAGWDCENIVDLTAAIENFEVIRDSAVSIIRDLVDEDDGSYKIVPEYIQKDLLFPNDHRHNSGFEILSFDACITNDPAFQDRIWDFIPCADIDEYGNCPVFVYAGDKKGNYLYNTYDGMHVKSETDSYWRVKNVFGDED